MGETGEGKSEGDGGREAGEIEEKRGTYVCVPCSREKLGFIFVNHGGHVDSCKWRGRYRQHPLVHRESAT